MSYFRLLCVILLSGFSTAAHADWPTTKYVVLEPDFHAGVRLPDAEVQKIEAMMERYALDYERRGWRAPRHQIKETPRGEGYVVYVRNIPGGPRPPRALSVCDDITKKSYIEIDPRRWIANLGSKYEAKNWQDLAHEMFHTIQAAYPPFQSCPVGKAIGDWVAEGTAEAMGIYMARNIADIRPYDICQIGARRYGQDLYLKDDDPSTACGGTLASYQTSSFWEFLGEWHAKRRPPTPQRTHKPDYRYLQKLFSTPLSEFDATSEYEWVNGSLDPQSGFSLRHAYTQFVGAFSGYIIPRKGFYRGGAKGDLDAWHKQIFGSCQSLSLESGPSPTLKMSLHPMSAKCFKAYTPAGGPLNIEITATGNVNLLPNLTISTENGKQLVPALLKPKSSPNRATFNFTIGGQTAGESFFIVANAATDPGKNFAQNIELAIVPALSTSSSAKGTKKGSSKKKKQDSSDEAYTDEYEQNQDNDSWQGTVTQIQRGRKCDKAFIDRICGERTKIVLALVPDQLSTITNSLKNFTPTDSSKRAGQVGSMAEINKLIAHEKRLAETEGSRVIIEIPFIEYGSTQSFTNAFIQMNKPRSAEKSRDYYNTKGPAWKGSCQKGHRVYSGKVTVEEASEQVLRGVFQGQMVDPDHPGKYYCRAMPVYKEISGRFVILSPDLGGDTQDPVLEAERIVDQVLDEASAIAPGIITPEMQERVRQKAKKATEAKKSGSSSAKLNETICDCQCERAGQNVTKSGCYDQCKEVYQQCKAPNSQQIKMLYDLARSPTPAEVEQFAQMRTEIVAWLEKESKKYVRETWLNQFDIAPHYMKQKIYDRVQERYGD